MGRRFVFVREVEQLVAKGQTVLELPEGTRISPLAADLIKEKGIRVGYGSGSMPGSGKESKSEESTEQAVTTTTSRARNVEIQQGLIAVASSGQTPSDIVGNVAARSPYFLFFNRKGELVEVLENPHRDAGGGAGPLVADLMAEKGATAMVAGNFGVNIRASLQEKGVKYLVLPGQVGEAVNAAFSRNP